ncbi:hypothetical protein H9P43_005928 [Blastocladiella emersonii ATCC 22665]|nr:hypothetical protein H9P43_005928 [Blastocladiella emersonii ATCC 22665]
MNKNHPPPGRYVAHAIPSAASASVFLQRLVQAHRQRTLQRNYERDAYDHARLLSPAHLDEIKDAQQIPVPSVSNNAVFMTLEPKHPTATVVHGAAAPSSTMAAELDEFEIVGGMAFTSGIGPVAPSVSGSTDATPPGVGGVGGGGGGGGSSASDSTAQHTKQAHPRDDSSAPDSAGPGNEATKRHKP